MGAKAEILRVSTRFIIPEAVSVIEKFYVISSLFYAKIRNAGLRLKNLSEVFIIKKPYFLVYVLLVVTSIEFLNSNPAWRQNLLSESSLRHRPFSSSPSFGCSRPRRQHGFVQGSYVGAITHVSHDVSY